MPRGAEERCAVVLQEVVQECRNEFAEQRARDDEEDAKRRDAHAQEVLKAHARDFQKFNEQQLDGLRESMAKHRDDAMRRYQAEMAQFRDEQLAELSKLTLDGFDEGEDTEDEDLGDWTDIARRAREHAGLPPDPDDPAHGARNLFLLSLHGRRGSLSSRLALGGVADDGVASAYGCCVS